MKFKLPKLDFNAEKFQELKKKFFQDRYEKIIKDLLELEIENPGDMRVKQKIAEIYYKKDRVDEAIGKYREIADHFEKADFILKAIKACKNILKIRPDLIEFNIKLAALYLKLGMTNEAASQYRIAVNHFAGRGQTEQTIKISQELVKIDPSYENRDKLAEIYQNFGMAGEAVKQYEYLAQHFRSVKDYDKLLHYYEMLLPHKKDNKALVKDVCILHLRRQRPERALKILELYKALDDVFYEELVKKARLMIDAMKKQPKKAS